MIEESWKSWVGFSFSRKRKSQAKEKVLGKKRKAPRIQIPSGAPIN
jgi:hypothetical protein